MSKIHILKSCSVAFIKKLKKVDGIYPWHLLDLCDLDKEVMILKAFFISQFWRQNHVRSSEEIKNLEN